MTKRVDNAWEEELAFRVYTPQRDEPPAYRLWQRTLGERWPLSRAVFHHTTVSSGAYQPGDHVVATLDDERVIGFAATQVRTLPSRSSTGELMVLMVDPAYQRRGIGCSLLNRALADLKRRGVTQVQLGAGGVSYFWAGARRACDRTPTGAGFENWLYRLYLACRLVWQAGLPGMAMLYHELEDAMR